MSALNQLDVAQQKAIHDFIRESEHREKLRMYKENSNMFHEIMTLFSILGLNAQMLRHVKDMPQSSMKYISGIDDVYQQMRRMLTNYIESSRLLDRERSMNLCHADLVEVIGGMCGSMQPLAQEHRVNLYFTHQSDSLPLHCDREKVERIVLNLLSNAIKFSYANGNVEVILDEDAMHAVIKVRDEGVGIPKKQQERLFERYAVADAGDKEQAHGFGLGLSIVYQMAVMHQGNVRVDSVPGRGSTFTVRLSKRIERTGGQPQ